MKVFLFILAYGIEKTIYRSQLGLYLQLQRRYFPHSSKCTRPQSGHIHVGPLLMPHLLSAKQAGQMAKPQVQLQQNGCCSLAAVTEPAAAPAAFFRFFGHRGDGWS
ncbi:MAG: hypothetical protein ACTFAK_04970 [Candidatus Electronema sp. VV]